MFLFGMLCCNTWNYLLFWGDNDELFAHASITFKRFSRVIMDLYGVNNVGEKSLVDDKIFYVLEVWRMSNIYTGF